jgi:hypothetical protein
MCVVVPNARILIIASFAISTAAFSPMTPTRETDQFGIIKINPTRPGGREWFLENALVFNSEWKPESSPFAFSQVSSGVFRTSGQVRLNIHSPSGKNWWRDVEMTGYFRYPGTISGGLNPHWEMFGRGERHTSATGTFS